MMHREVVERKRTHVIVLTLLLITCILYLVEGLQALKLENTFFMKGAEFILLAFMAIFVFIEFLSCNVAYKYSIIADKLIINKIFKGTETNLESIKISNIVFIGKKKDMPKEYKKKCKYRYTCELFGKDTIVCVYKNEEKIEQFTFEPSAELQRRLVKYKKAV